MEIKKTIDDFYFLNYDYLDKDEPELKIVRFYLSLFLKYFTPKIVKKFKSWGDLMDFLDKTLNLNQYYYSASSDKYMKSNNIKWFSNKIDTVKVFGCNIYMCKLKIIDPYIVECRGNYYNELPIQQDVYKFYDDNIMVDTFDTDNYVEYVLEINKIKPTYKCIIFKNIFEGNGNTKISDVVVPLDNSLITVFHKHNICKPDF